MFDSDDAMFFGYSLGGLFATYVLPNEPATFRRFGIGSPSFGGTQGWCSTMRRLTRVRMSTFRRRCTCLLAGMRTRRAASVSANSSTPMREQEPKPRTRRQPPSDRVADVERMVELLRGRAYPSLEIDHEVLPGEYHETGPALSLSRSLRYVFDAPR